jgi:hypothetical protein
MWDNLRSLALIGGRPEPFAQFYWPIANVIEIDHIIPGSHGTIRTAKIDFASLFELY